jgi:hypothetical protein
MLAAQTAQARAGRLYRSSGITSIRWGDPVSRPNHPEFTEVVGPERGSHSKPNADALGDPQNTPTRMR